MNLFSIASFMLSPILTCNNWTLTYPSVSLCIFPALSSLCFIMLNIFALTFGNFQSLFPEIFFLLFSFLSPLLGLLLHVCWYALVLQKLPVAFIIASFIIYDGLWRLCKIWLLSAVLTLFHVNPFLTLISCSSYMALQLLLEQNLWRRGCVPDKCYFLCL